MFCGLPQGLLRRSLLFLLQPYTAVGLQLIESHGLRPHLNADDKQIYELFAPNDSQSPEIRLSAYRSCF